MSGPFSTTMHVWQALFLREALDRLFGSRAAWAWLLVEPAMHIGFMGFVWGMMRRNSMGGVNTTVWIIVGMLAFFLFRRTGVQAMHALDCNKAFFAFRQVRPFDAALVRAGEKATSAACHTSCACGGRSARAGKAAPWSCTRGFSRRACGLCLCRARGTYPPSTAGSPQT